MKRDKRSGTAAGQAGQTGQTWCSDKIKSGTNGTFPLGMSHVPPDVPVPVKEGFGLELSVWVAIGLVLLMLALLAFPMG